VPNIKYSDRFLIGRVLGDRGLLKLSWRAILLIQIYGRFVCTLVHTISTMRSFGWVLNLF